MSEQDNRNLALSLTPKESLSNQQNPSGSRGSRDATIDFIFLAKTENAKIISQILSTLYMKKDQLATITLLKTGVKVTVEQAKSAQGYALLQAELFREYHYTETPGQKDSFQIPFSVLLDCLNIYGVGSPNFPALQIAYKGYGYPLLLMLEENDVLTDCGIRTLEAEPTLTFNLRSYPIISKIIINSDSLKEAFSEMDWSSTAMTWFVSPNAPYFRLSTHGTGTSCEVDYPKDSEVFEVFQCSETQQFMYKMKFLQMSVKALAVAKKTQIRINQQGLLSLQHMITTDDGQTSFVDFFFVPMDEDEEKDKEN
jgi:cell cycle checkpoint protein